jgi:hypothetical protein
VLSERLGPRMALFGVPNWDECEALAWVTCCGAVWGGRLLQ